MTDNTETYTATGTDYNLRNDGTSATPLSYGDSRLPGGAISTNADGDQIYIIEYTRDADDTSEEYEDTITINVAAEDAVIEEYEYETEIEVFSEIAETTVDVVTEVPITIAGTATATVTATATRVKE